MCRLVGSVLTIGCLLAVSACGGSSDSSTTSGTASATSAQATAGGGKKIALLTTGTENDQGWGQAFTMGAREAAKSSGAQLSVVANLDNPPQYAQQGSAFGQKGYDVVLMALGTLKNVQYKLAKQFPHTIWCAVGVPEPSAPENTCFIDPQQQDVAFLGGVAAGLATKSDVVGSVNGFAFPQLTRQPEAYDLGARCVNPNVKFVQKYINSWTDSGLAKAATQGLMSQGADVILAPLAGAVKGVYAGARAKQGTWVVPLYFDAYETAPDVVLTSLLFDLQGVSNTTFTKALKGEFAPREYLKFNLKDLPGAGLAPFHGNAAAFGDAKVARLDAIEQKVKDGTIKVPTTDQLSTEGSGAKIDPKSIGC